MTNLGPKPPCGAPDCTRPAASHRSGLCTLHRKRVAVHGHTGPGPGRGNRLATLTTPESPCAWPDCTGPRDPARLDGRLCTPHAERARPPVWPWDDPDRRIVPDRAPLPLPAHVRRQLTPDRDAWRP